MDDMSLPEVRKNENVFGRQPLRVSALGILHDPRVIGLCLEGGTTTRSEERHRVAFVLERERTV